MKGKVEGWKVEKLGDVCENLDSQRIPVTQRDRKSGEYPYYGASGIVDYVDSYIFDEDLLLVSEDGANLLARTYPIAFSISGKSWVNNHAHVLRFKNKISQRFVEYYLNSISLEKYVNGMAQPKLNQAMLNSIPIPYPPLPEQQRIVSLLDETFAALAQVHANAEQNLVNAREVFESYLKSIFETKNAAWEDRSLGDIGKICMCKRIFKEQTTTTGDIPFYKIGTFGKEPDAYISKEIYDEFRNNFSFPKKGDILISASGTIGRRVKYDGKPAYFQDSNIVWVDNDENQVLNDYLYHFYGACNWNSTKGATIARLYTTNLKELEIVFPKSLEEQRAIVQRLDALAGETQRLETVYQSKLEAVEELRKSVLGKAFEGEL